MISNETLSAAGQNEILCRKPSTLCQRFAEIKSFRQKGQSGEYIRLDQDFLKTS